jgi:Flp pilus assembly pilin Flp
MNRNHLLLTHLLHDTCGADLVEYGLIAVALLLTAAAAASSTAVRLVTEINILEILAVTCAVTAVVGFVLPLSAAIKGH